MNGNGCTPYLYTCLGKLVSLLSSLYILYEIKKKTSHMVLKMNPSDSMQNKGKAVRPNGFFYSL